MMDGDDVSPDWLAAAVGHGVAAAPRLVGRGLWGPTFELGDGTLVKMVRRSAGIGDGLETSANEARVLAALGGQRLDGLAVPRLLDHGAFAAQTPAALAGYGAWLRLTRVPGTPFNEALLAALPAAERARFADSYGRAIAVFQQAATRVVGRRLAGLDDRVRRLLTTLPDVCADAADRDLCAALLDALAAKRRDGFVHGDAHLENIMVDSDHRVCGFIDLAEGGRGFPEIDLAYLHWLPEIAEPARRSYEAVAGPIDPSAYQLAGAISALTGVVIAGRLGDAAALAADRALLRTCLAASGIHRA